VGEGEVRAKSCVCVCVCLRVYVREKIISCRFVIRKTRLCTNIRKCVTNRPQSPFFRKLHLPNSVLRHTDCVSILAVA